MKRKAKVGIVLAAVILMTLALIYMDRFARSPVSNTSEYIEKASNEIRKGMELFKGTVGINGQKLQSFPKESSHAIAPNNIHWKLADQINDLADPKLSEVDRNRIEHTLASNPDEIISKKIRLMLEDGLLELSEQLGTGMERLMSAIRIAGLREDAKSVESIINICTHPETNEDLQMVGYEALGYIGTETANQFLRKELTLAQCGFLQSQIVLSLGTAQDIKSSRQFLSLLNHPDPDLRDSAIIALGKTKEVRAVPRFKEMYAKTTESSRILIVQALKDIGSPDAADLLSEIAKGQTIF